MSKKNKFIVQPCDLSTMCVEAERMDVDDNGIAFLVDNEVVFYSPHQNTKYVTIDGVSHRLVKS